MGHFFALSAQCPISITTQPSDATTCSGRNRAFTVVVVASVDITGYLVPKPEKTNLSFFSAKVELNSVVSEAFRITSEGFFTEGVGDF
jgi:hypothetical protein